MSALLIPVLATAATAASIAMAVVSWVRLKAVDRGAITVVNKATGKAATLPRNYSPAAVEQLLELTA